MFRIENIVKRRCLVEKKRFGGNHFFVKMDAERFSWREKDTENVGGDCTTPTKIEEVDGLDTRN